MVDTGVAERTTLSPNARARTLAVGGILLVASVLLGYSVQGGFPGSGYISMFVVTAAFLVLALGPGSVTARRPLGTIALVVLAVWTPVTSIFQSVLLQSAPPSLGDPGWLVGGYATLAIEFALAVIVVTQIARAGVVPRPWNWAPAWVLAAVAIVFVVQQVVGFSAARSQPLDFTFAVINSLVNTAGTSALGVLAIVLADRIHRDAVLANEAEPTR